MKETSNDKDLRNFFRENHTDEALSVPSNTWEGVSSSLEGLRLAKGLPTSGESNHAGIKDYFEQSFADGAVPVSPAVWEKLETQLEKKRAEKKRRRVFFWMWFVLVGCGISSGTAYFFWPVDSSNEQLVSTSIDTDQKNREYDPRIGSKSSSQSAFEQKNALQDDGKNESELSVEQQFDQTSSSGVSADSFSSNLNADDGTGNPSNPSDSGSSNPNADDGTSNSSNPSDVGSSNPNADDGTDNPSNSSGTGSSNPNADDGTSNPSNPSGAGSSNPNADDGTGNRSNPSGTGSSNPNADDGTGNRPNSSDPGSSKPTSDDGAGNPSNSSDTGSSKPNTDDGTSNSSNPSGTESSNPNADDGTDNPSNSSDSGSSNPSSDDGTSNSSNPSGTESSNPNADDGTDNPSNSSDSGSSNPSSDDGTSDPSNSSETASSNPNLEQDSLKHIPQPIYPIPVILGAPKEIGYDTLKVSPWEVAVYFGTGRRNRLIVNDQNQEDLNSKKFTKLSPQRRWYRQSGVRFGYNFGNQWTLNFGLQTSLWRYRSREFQKIIVKEPGAYEMDAPVGRVQADPNDLDPFYQAAAADTLLFRIAMRQNLRYLSLPLAVQFKMATKKLQPYFRAGLSVNVLYWQRTHLIFRSVGIERTVERVDVEGLRRLHLSAQGAFGFQWQLAPKFSMFAEGALDRPLGGFYKSQNGTAEIRSAGWGGKLGFIFKF